MCGCENGICCERARLGWVSVKDHLGWAPGAERFDIVAGMWPEETVMFREQFRAFA